MRKIRVLAVVAVLAVAAIAPAVAQAQVEATPWGWASLAERVVGWIEGVWTAVAGSETGPALPPDGGATDGVAPDGPGIAVTADDPSTQGEVFPELDPDG